MCRARWRRKRTTEVAGYLRVSLGLKRMAFTHELHWDNAKNRWLREISDNDLGWSTHHWSAQAFKYAATGDPAAKRAAIDGFNALKWSEEITSIDGYPARSIWAVGETGIQAMHGSGGYDAEWHPAEDARFEWKGDTSMMRSTRRFTARRSCTT